MVKQACKKINKGRFTSSSASFRHCAMMRGRHHSSTLRRVSVRQSFSHTPVLLNRVRVLGDERRGAGLRTGGLILADRATASGYRASLLTDTCMVPLNRDTHMNQRTVRRWRTSFLFSYMSIDSVCALGCVQCILYSAYSNCLVQTKFIYNAITCI